MTSSHKADQLRTNLPTHLQVVLLSLQAFNSPPLPYFFRWLGVATRGAARLASFVPYLSKGTEEAAKGPALRLRLRFSQTAAAPERCLANRAVAPTLLTPRPHRSPPRPAVLLAHVPAPQRLPAPPPVAAHRAASDCVGLRAWPLQPLKLSWTIAAESHRLHLPNFSTASRRQLTPGCCKHWVLEQGMSLGWFGDWGPGRRHARTV